MGFILKSLEVGHISWLNEGTREEVDEETEETDEDVKEYERKMGRDYIHSYESYDGYDGYNG